MPVQLRDEALLDALVEERHVVGALVEHGAEDVLQQRLGERRVVGEIGECDLGLDHPEFREVPARVRVLGAKRRPERVDLRQREAIRLDVQLPGHGQERFAAEEILREVDRTVRVARQVREVERRHAKQLAGALGVRRRDDRRADPEEAVVVEEAVNRMRDRIAHARHRADHVGARTQVRDVAQEFERVRLRLDRVRIGILDPADDANGARLHLERLALGRRRHDVAGDLDRASGGQVHDLVGVVRQRVRHDRLHRMEARAVRNVHERDAGLRVAPRADPAAQRRPARPSARGRRGFAHR